MLDGVDVTKLGESQILATAASWVRLDANDVEFHDAPEEAFAVVIYVTLDRRRRAIHEEGIVMLSRTRRRNQP
ncbi:hypothetical protein ACJ41O_010216 [Fusarium nematophilum]